MKFSPASAAVRSGLSLVLFSALALGQARGTLPVSATGANVDESRVQKTIYVDPAHPEAADDDKHGPPDAPFATLDFACRAAAKWKDANVGVKIVLAAGTYREAAEIRPPPAGAADTDAPLVIEAAEREQAVLDGADTEGWSPSTWKVEETRWTHPWPFHRPPVPPPAGLPPGAASESYRRGDLIFINGTIQRQVNTPADLAPGCLWTRLPASPASRRATKTAAAANAGPLAVIQPPADTELAGAIIQVGVRARGLTIIGRRNVVVRGLLIQHTAEPGGAGENTAGLVLDGCANVLVEDVLSQWNDGVGLVILGRADGSVSADFTLRRVRLLHNGGSGVAAYNLKNLLAEDCETSFNNFRGEWAGWIDPFGSAGVRAGGPAGVSVSTWRRHHAVGNACGGMWWLENGADLLVEDAVVRDNLVCGLRIESNHGPALVRRCVIAGTKNDPAVWASGGPLAGLWVQSTPDVTLESNVIADNAPTQFCIGYGKPLQPTDHHAYRHNVFSSAVAECSLYRMPAPDQVGAPASYYATLDSGENCFWNAGTSETVAEYSYQTISHKPFVLYKSQSLRWEDWRADLQKQAAAVDDKSSAKIEIGSIWQDPLFVDPAEGDHRLKGSSPVGDWDLPSDDAAAAQ